MDGKYRARWIAVYEPEAVEVLQRARRHPHGSPERVQVLKELPSSGFPEAYAVAYGHMLRLCGEDDPEEVLLGLGMMAHCNLHMPYEDRLATGEVLERLCAAEGQDPRILAAALRGLGLYSADLERLPLLAGMLRHEDPAVRSAAVRGIRQLNHASTQPRGIEDLLALAVDDPDPQVRQTAVEEAGFVIIGELLSRYREVLLKAAHADPDEQVRSTALDLLAARYDWRSPTLKSITRPITEDDWARENGQLLLTLFTEAASDSDPGIRRAGLAGVTTLVPLEGALDVVRAHYADSHPDLRAMALCTGAGVLDEEALRLLRAELADPHVDRAYLDAGAWPGALWEETYDVLCRLLHEGDWTGLLDREGWDPEQRRKYLYDLKTTIRNRHPWDW
ncbi:HEAT repeat domain-containing protein [Nonomuraea sp. NPDC050786]|uniref:HEAT repeat domain-containing protein n=1 Tax=Nonomuraea sp. NPDC050786 TaxID=3154840 RepID=UPI0033CEE662